MWCVVRRKEASIDGWPHGHTTDGRSDTPDLSRPERTDPWIRIPSFFGRKFVWRVVRRKEGSIDGWPLLHDHTADGRFDTPDL